jgi:hypothetical protein
MATGRQDVDFEGVDPVVLPFKIDNSTIVWSDVERGSVSIDLAVKLVSARTIALVVDGDSILGKLLKVEADGFASVQVGGGCTLPAGNAAAVTAGKKIVGALGAAAAKGYIRDVTAPTGTYAQATATEAMTGRHCIYDPTTTTAVQVMLDA